MEPNPSGRTLVLLRHGHSAANGADTVSGWLDVPLSGRGCREAARAGALLAEHGCRPDVVHTSVLTRAIRTADLALAELGRPWPPVHRSWRLNERHYGALQGRARDALRAEYGAEPWPTSGPGSSRTGTMRSPRTCGPAGRRWWWRTATPCGALHAPGRPCRGLGRPLGDPHRRAPSLRPRRRPAPLVSGGEYLDRFAAEVHARDGAR